MAEELTGYQAFTFVNAFTKATLDCSKRCESIKLDEEFGDEEKACLQKCTVYHAGFTIAHLKFIKAYEENQVLFQR